MEDAIMAVHLLADLAVVLLAALEAVVEVLADSVAVALAVAELAEAGSRPFDSNPVIFR